MKRISLDDMEEVMTPEVGTAYIQIGIVSHTGYEGVTERVLSEDAAAKLWKLFDLTTHEINAILEKYL